MRKFILKYVPSVLSCLLAYFTHRALFFGASVVSAMVEGIIDDDTENVNLVPLVGTPEVTKRVIQ